MMETSQEDEWKTLTSQVDVIDLVSRSGWRQTLSFRDKDHLIQSLIFNCVICLRKSAIDQFCEGLSVGGVLQQVKLNPDLMKPLFTPDNCPVTGEK